MPPGHKLPSWVVSNLRKLPFRRELPRWPILTAVGEDVSPELGREICVRTTALSQILPWIGVNKVSLNDAWLKKVVQAYGIEDVDEFEEAAGSPTSPMSLALSPLHLRYLGNDRVTASRFEAPSGWCDWNGTIGTYGTYLDAKWPTLDMLNDEVKLISQAWPELTMTMQLSTYKGAETYDEYHPFLTWDIQHGCALLRREPGEALCSVELPTPMPEEVTSDTMCGTDAETLRQAITETKEKVNR